MKDYEITTVVRVTAEQIDDVMTTALEGGINYWCDSATAEPVVKHKYASEMLTLGSIINLHDNGEEKWHVLTLDKLLNALGKRQFNFDDYDAGDVDCVIQTAIFGEVIYG